MTDQSFKDRLRETLGNAAEPTAFGAALDDLKSIAASLEDLLNERFADRPIEIRPDLGFEARIGRQVNVRVAIPKRQFQECLFRVYIPSSGYPVQVDLFGEELVACPDRDQVQGLLLDFLARPATQDRLRQVRDYAARS